MEYPKSIEERILEEERTEFLHRAINTLPEIQRRRFLLYYESVSYTHLDVYKRQGYFTENMQNAQELLVGNALEYIKGISVLRIFGKGKEGKGKVYQAFENKCRSDIAVTISTSGIMKLY